MNDIMKIKKRRVIKVDNETDKPFELRAVYTTPKRVALKPGLDSQKIIDYSKIYADF